MTLTLNVCLVRAGNGPGGVELQGRSLNLAQAGKALQAHPEGAAIIVDCLPFPCDGPNQFGFFSPPTPPPTHTPTHTHTHPHTHTLHEMARITSDSSLPGFVPPEADLRILRAAGRPGDLLLRYTDAGVRAGLPAGPAQRGLPGLHRLGEPLPPAAGAKREGSCATALPLPCRVLPPPLQHGRFLSGSAGRTPTRSGRTCG